MKLTHSIIIISLLAIWSPLNAQFDLKWTIEFGGSSFDNIYSATQTSDGGYIVCGASGSDDLSGISNYGQSDVIVFKIDQNQEIEWIRNYGGSEGEDVFDIIESMEGGYLLVGGSGSDDIDLMTNNGQSDTWILKIDSVGNIEWSTSFGDNLWDNARSVVQNTDGDYLIASRSQKSDFDTDLVFTKISQNGNIIWQREYGGSSTESVASIIQVQDGDFIVSATSQSNDINNVANYGGDDFLLLKVDGIGNILWKKNFGGSGADVATSVIETSQGDLMLIGRSYSDDIDIDNLYGVGDYFILKLTSNGDVIWKKTYGGSEIDNPTQILETDEQKFVVIGYGSSQDGDVPFNYGLNDFWIIQIDENGLLEYSNTFGGSRTDRIRDLIPAHNGNFIVIGSSFSDDFDLNENNGQSDYWIAEIGLSTSNTEIDLSQRLHVFPNPNNGSFNISLSDHPISGNLQVFNVDGKLVYHQENIGTSVLIEGMPSGLYTLMIKTKESTFVQKLIVVN